MNAAAARWDQSQDEIELDTIVGAMRLLLIEEHINKVVSLKRGMMFADSSLPYPTGAGSVAGAGGLSVIALHEGRPVPLIVPGPPEIRWVRFHSWWREGAPVRQNHVAMTREFLIYELAQTESQHFDLMIDQEYGEIRRAIAGLTIHRPGESPLAIPSVVPACVRQIAWELDLSLRRAFPEGPSTD